MARKVVRRRAIKRNQKKRESTHEEEEEQETKTLVEEVKPISTTLSSEGVEAAELASEKTKPTVTFTDAIEVPRGYDENESAKESDADIVDPCTPRNQTLRKRHFDSCDKENLVLSHRTLKTMFMDEEQLNFMLYSLDDEIESKCNRLKSITETQCKKLEMELNKKLVMFPNSIRKMTVKEFQEKYNEDISNIMKDQAKRNTAAIEKIIEESKKTAIVPKTPSANKISSRLSHLPPRTPQTSRINNTPLVKKTKTQNYLNTPSHHNALQNNPSLVKNFKTKVGNEPFKINSPTLRSKPVEELVDIIKQLYEQK